MVDSGSRGITCTPISSQASTRICLRIHAQQRCLVPGFHRLTKSQCTAFVTDGESDVVCGLKAHSSPSAGPHCRLRLCPLYLHQLFVIPDTLCFSVVITRLCLCFPARCIASCLLTPRWPLLSYLKVTL